MSLINLEQKNILTQWQNREELSFPKKISLALAAFFLSTNLVLAEPNKTIWLISFESWGTAELCVNKDWKYFIQNWNAKNGSDYIYGTVIIDGKIYIVYSDSYENDLKLFLKSDIEIYRDYYKKYWNELSSAT